MEQIVITAHNYGTASLTVTVLIYVYVVSLVISIIGFACSFFSDLRGEWKYRDVEYNSRTTWGDIFMAVIWCVLPAVNTLVAVGWIFQEWIPIFTRRIKALLNRPIIPYQEKNK